MQDNFGPQMQGKRDAEKRHHFHKNPHPHPPKQNNFFGIATKPCHAHRQTQRFFRPFLFTQFSDLKIPDSSSICSNIMSDELNSPSGGGGGGVTVPLLKMEPPMTPHYSPPQQQLGGGGGGGHQPPTSVITKMLAPNNDFTCNSRLLGAVYTCDFE
jgi:hypothetical protein